MQANIRKFIGVGVQVGGTFLPELAGGTGELAEVGPGKFNYLANGQVVGRVSVAAQGAGVLRVSWIAVDKAVRGQGIATALLKQAIRSAEAGGPAITTVTATTNYGAVTALTRVLEDLGYRVTAQGDEIGIDLSGVR
jgi:ribosomal protein S18 acetylase RimI-like enzyme